ncbi:hypothetical protein XU18_3957 [Perkinsela sp. CCAP 1560/4]|nr:hypothetical protein XU18_3957 [Perkinsela sp. CCAP 1560/4]|eukprot:KNH04899.1 hypothetical protein XU18_3957 [Perkinsela sp. CCAP 1560/4]
MKPGSSCTDSNICSQQASDWTLCVSALPYSKNDKELCLKEETNFSECIESWRGIREENRFFQMRGEYKGEACPQCRPFSCMYESCMQTTMNPKRCSHIMESFRKCVKMTYLADFVQ